MNALHVLADAGLRLRAEGSRLIVAPAERLTDPLRALIRQHKAALLESAREVRAAGNPLLTAQQASDCHAGGWDDAEISAFATRVFALMRHGIKLADADDLAERLTLRDREGDDRHVCAECRHYRPGRCPDGAPLPAGVLHRCPGFAP